MNDEGGEVFLNSRPYREVEIKPIAPASEPQNPAFLSRVMMTQGPTAQRIATWSVHPEDYSYAGSCLPLRPF